MGLPLSSDSIHLDATTRGVPLVEGIAAGEVGARKWSPANGDLGLPALTLDEAAFAHNRDLFLRYCASVKALVAPHAKTPMSPELSASLRQAGAWGASVAGIQQAAVLLASGERRLILANEIGGLAAGRRLGALLAAYPDAEIHVFADSPAAVAAYAEAARVGKCTALSVLVEVGVGRAGARDAAAIDAVIAAVVAADGLVLGGVATYEGAAAVADPDATARAIAALMTCTADAFARVRMAAPGRHLIVTAGGSLHFDRVVAALGPLVERDRNAVLMLRSGAIFFSDHGIYAKGFAAMDARGGFTIDGVPVSAQKGFRPALTLWAEVLSRPQPDLAICGFGMRDVSFDQGLPVALAVYRDGVEQAGLADGLAVARLNDQHAFLTVPAASRLAVGDILAFGISHPCTCFDRWRVVFGLGGDGTVTRALTTHFG
jgi:D-serine dehydratase